MTDETAVAAAYVGNKTIEALNLPARELRSGEVEISPAFTGSCGTDLHVLHGAMDSRVTCPAVLGHEMSGTVSRVGPGVSGWSAGDPVTVVPLLWDDDIAAVVAQWTCDAGVSLSFEVSGAPAGIAAAVDSLAVRGRLCVVAVHPVPREMSLHRFFWRELTLVGTRLYSRPDWDRAVAVERGGEVMKVLVDCQTAGNTA